MKYVFNSAIFLVLIILTISCSKTRTSKVEGKQNIEIETPKVLLKEEIVASDLIGSGYGSYRSYQDMINELFNEACKKDDELNKLHRSIQSEISNSQNMLNEFRDYGNVVEKVWNSALTHAGKINNDSLLVNKLVALSEGNKKSFSKMIKLHQSEIEKIRSNSERLENALEELKIKTALKMMKGFQDNEIPALELLNDMNKVLGGLINDTKAQSDFAK